MSRPEKTSSRKNTKISFRTDDKTIRRLKSICRYENKTISSLIENVLTEHVLRNENPMLVEGEKRKSPRKKCSLPSVITSHYEDKKFYSNGVIVNISLSTLQIIIKEEPNEIMQNNDFHVLFTLPTSLSPLLLCCKFTRIDYMLDECIVIAQFSNSKKFESEAILKYLSSSNYKNIENP